MNIGKSIAYWLGRFIVEPWRAEQRRNAEFLRSSQAEQIDWEVILVLIAVAVALSLQFYGFTAGDFLLDRFGISPDDMTLAQYPNKFEEVRDLKFEIPPDDMTLAHRVHWAIGQTLLYVLIPLITIRLILRKPLRDYGLKFRGILASAWVYLAMYLCMVPIVLWLCDAPGFQQTYPFYQPHPDQAFWPRFLLWESLYALQFVALEFFFRGFMVHGLKRRFGVYSIFVMTVPYCMIHFGKPMPETLAAIVAGVALGFMSLKTNSIWFGAALHIAVAWSMDAAALWRG